MRNIHEAYWMFLVRGSHTVHSRNSATSTFPSRCVSKWRRWVFSLTFRSPPAQNIPGFLLITMTALHFSSDFTTLMASASFEKIVWMKRCKFTSSTSSWDRAFFCLGLLSSKATISVHRHFTWRRKYTYVHFQVHIGYVLLVFPSKILY